MARPGDDHLRPDRIDHTALDVAVEADRRQEAGVRGVGYSHGAVSSHAGEPSGEETTSRTMPVWWTMPRGAPSATFQTRTFSSRPPLASQDPSGATVSARNRSCGR